MPVLRDFSCPHCGYNVTGTFVGDEFSVCPECAGILTYDAMLRARPLLSTPALLAYMIAPTVAMCILFALAYAILGTSTSLSKMFSGCFGFTTLTVAPFVWLAAPLVVNFHRWQHPITGPRSLGMTIVLYITAWLISAAFVAFTYWCVTTFL